MPDGVSNPPPIRFLGIEIGGTKLQIVAADDELTIHHRWRGQVDRALGAEGIRRQLAAALEELLENATPRAIGVGFGGPVDWRSGRIGRSHQIGGWDDFSLADWLFEMTGLPAIIDNDANVAGLGEALAGAGRDANPVFYVTLGSGVGGGLVIDGAIYHGAAPGEAEFGHLRLDRSGTIVESRCSGWAIDARIGELILQNPDSILARLARIAPTPAAATTVAPARHLAPALAQNDPLAHQILDELSGDLAFALSHVVHLFHPQAIILGGGLSLVGAPLRDAVAAALPPLVMEVFHPVPFVKLAALGEDAVPVGALALAQSSAQSPR